MCLTSGYALKAEATIELALESEEQLKALMDSLVVEEKQTGFRSRVTVTSEANNLRIDVEAKDSVALRAGLNTYLRWIESILKVLTIVSGKN